VPGRESDARVQAATSCRGLDPPPAPSPLIAEQFRSLLSRPADKLIVSLVMYAGVRPEEALAVTVSVIRGDFDELWIWRVVANGKLGPIKNGKRHGIPILKPLADDLRTYLETAPPNNERGLLITRPDGSPWTSKDYRLFAKRFKRAKRWTDARDVDYTPYDLRAGYATMMLDSGTSLRDVAAHLGDRDDTVMRYYSRSGHNPDRKLPPEDQIRRARAQVAQDPPQRPRGRPPKGPA
jgi:integrase